MPKLNIDKTKVIFYFLLKIISIRQFNNILLFTGFQMLQKLGWSEGQGLGSEGSGRIEPINK